MDPISSPCCYSIKRSKRKSKQQKSSIVGIFCLMQLPPPVLLHHPALPQRAPSLGTYVRCSDGQRQSLLPAKRRSLDLNCLLAASNVPLLLSALRQTGNGRVGLTWFDKKACVMQSCLPPFSMYSSIRSFLQSNYLFSFSYGKHNQSPFLHQTFTSD